MFKCFSIQLCWRAAARAGSSFCGIRTKKTKPSSCTSKMTSLPLVSTAPTFLETLMTPGNPDTRKPSLVEASAEPGACVVDRRTSRPPALGGAALFVSSRFFYFSSRVIRAEYPAPFETNLEIRAEYSDLFLQKSRPVLESLDSFKFSNIPSN